ncbi:PadR family transcriptional regulator [Cupriavidus sp. AU9028]|uniref:PadR family transcriptional regulator n=1 Tax=Cupriavidus sp. AU9028 TaxID=2871157 RepID=UPI001C95B197|nr:PadR family transcriptional regulator [Cupriavidus sp. AU9028]MBY4896028.1 PadR family transcriptional regulator [Cupriavidus sp. AU9028]
MDNKSPPQGKPSHEMGRPRFRGDPADSEARLLHRGRKLGSAELQLLLLDLLAEHPGHGYELMQALEVRSNGFYKPSPGMMYPALTALLEAGSVHADAEGNRKRYRISDAGRQRLSQQREDTAVLWKRLIHAGKKMEWVRRALANEGSAEEAGEAVGWAPELVAARSALKRALLMRTDASVDAQRRIASILQQAVAQIEQVPAPDTRARPKPQGD